MSKRRHNFGRKHFKEKSLFKFHARIVLKSLILLFVRLIARGARIGKKHTQTHRHTDRTSTVILAHARRGLIICDASQPIIILISHFIFSKNVFFFFFVYTHDNISLIFIEGSTIVGASLSEPHTNHIYCCGKSSR